MQRADAQAMVKTLFQSAFDTQRYAAFVRELTNGNTKTPTTGTMAVPDAFAEHIKSCTRLGTYENDRSELVDILVVQVQSSFKIDRTRTALRNFVAHKLKRGDGADNNYKEAALVAFVAPDAKEWRFSFVRMEYTSVRDPITGKYKTEEHLTPARRFTYLVGPAEQSHTAQSRFIDLLVSRGQPSVDDLMAAFSVEKVTNEFFDAYKKLFLRTLADLKALCAADATLAAEFTRADINHADFAKKMLGQIVFLYFLQKKGWLGVANDQPWGSGPTDFMRTLARRAEDTQRSLFNDILEPLFYETLAVDRKSTGYWAEALECRIPFLNGGLFEAYHGYDWRNTEITFPNTLFTNAEQTGILDVFDRYNFTVDEAEPLETDVAIDPEMLGKVFENLLDVDDRAATGAFYTPREIVHYMCQLSLVHYLQRSMTTAKLPVSQADIEALVYRGDQAAEYERARLSGTSSYTAQLPASIQTHAQALDTALATITVLDPAIGSGAFPVGMMNEIVRVRSVLSAYFSDHHARTVYEFKRHAIQASLYGVDIAAGAVEIAKLRLWLSLVVDEDDVSRIKPLPNLDFKIVVGNSLLDATQNVFNHFEYADLNDAKRAFFDETNHERKEALRAKIQAIIARLMSESAQFDFQIYFNEVYDRPGNAPGGFDIVIGNPPYVVSNDKVLRNIYKESVYGRPNLYGFFIHRSLESLMSQDGITVFINPRTLLTDAYFTNLRKFILRHGSVYTVMNIVDRHNVFDNVLQSTIVNSFVKEKNLGTVRVKNVATKGDIFRDNELTVEIEDFILGRNEACLFIVSDGSIAYGIFRKLSRQKTFEDNGIIFTTGKIQWDLYKEFLSDNPMTETSTRLLWAENLQRYRIVEPRLRGDRKFINTTVGDSVATMGNTIALQRVTSVEQRYRIIATLVSESIIGYRFELENHTSYMVQNSKNVNMYFILGLLNSDLFDFYFRNINSNTQVSAGELNMLPFPIINDVIVNDIINIVEKLLDTSQSSENSGKYNLELNKCVCELFGLNADEVHYIKSLKE